jgi:hypothetical protein
VLDHAVAMKCLAAQGGEQQEIEMPRVRAARHTLIVYT